MNYLEPAWMIGLHDNSYRRTGRTQRMTRLMVISICENEAINASVAKQKDVFILAAATSFETNNIYNQIMDMLQNIILMKELRYTKIIKGIPESFVKNPKKVYGERIKESNIFIDHNVFENYNEYTHDFLKLINSRIIKED